MLKVLYFHHSGGRGGSSNSLFNLLKTIPDSLVEKFIVTVNGPVVELFKRLTKNVVVIDSMPQMGSTAGVNDLILRNVVGLLNFFRVKKKIKSLILEINPDIVHINEITSIQIAKIAKSLGKKVVCHIRVVPDPKLFWINFFVKKMLKRYVDEIVCIDYSVASHFKDFANLHVVYNVIEHRKDINIVNHNSDRVNCIFLSNLLRHKGIFELLKASEYLKEQSNVHFLIVGGNTKPHSFFKSPIGRISEILKIHVDIERILREKKFSKGLDNLHIFGHSDNIETYLKESHILLFPSYMNGPSRSVFEAGLYGIPSIIALKDKIEDVVTDNFNGFIVKEGDSIDLANKIKILSENSNLRKSMGINARERFLNLNSEANAKTQMLSIYKNLVNVNI
jgi:glycosyltransferase involved in cell wall biosynthesis